MKKKLKALKQAFDELNASHESLKEDHEELRKAHKKKFIWVPKSLVTNLQGPKQVWVPKRN